MKRVFTIFFLTNMLFAEGFFPKKTYVQDLEEFEQKPKYKSEAYQSGESWSRIPNDETTKDEYDYYAKKCPSTELRDSAQILYSLSPFDSVFVLKNCSEIPESLRGGLEKSTKQKIYDLSFLPLYEKIQNVELPDHSIFTDSFAIWKRTVYRYSNFYKNDLLFLETERQFSNQLIRVLYSESSISQKLISVKKITEDMRNHNLAKLQMYLYSKQNPVFAKNLEEENSFLYKYFKSSILLFLDENEISEVDKIKLKQFESCLDRIKEDSNQRLLLFYGYFSDYERFLYTPVSKTNLKASQQWNFVKRTVFQSHHFSGRSLELSETCSLIQMGL